MARLKEKYNNEIVDAMTKRFGYENIMQEAREDCSKHGCRRSKRELQDFGFCNC